MQSCGCSSLIWLIMAPATPPHKLLKRCGASVKVCPIKVVSNYFATEVQREGALKRRPNSANLLNWCACLALSAT